MKFLIRPRQAAIPVIKTSTLGAFACAVGSIAVVCIVGLLFPERPFLVALTSVASISATVAFPLLYMIGMRNEALRKMRKQLQHALRHDPLTGTLSADAFAATVDHAIERRRSLSAENPGGIMLVLKAGNLDEISRRYGPHWADTVMRSLANIVRASIRREDVVGRLGTNELGILLLGAREENALSIGVRIQEGIARNSFNADNGVKLEVDVVLGGALFDEEADFNLIRHSAGEIARSASNPGALPLERIQ